MFIQLLKLYNLNKDSQSKANCVPLENFCTECLVGILEFCGLKSAFVSEILKGRPEIEQNLTIKTQVQYNKGKDIPDIVISSKNAVYFLEMKVYASEGNTQLKRYRKVLDDMQGPKEKKLVFCTKNDYSPEADLNIKWTDIYVFLHARNSNLLIADFLHMLDSKRIACYVNKAVDYSRTKINKETMNYFIREALFETGGIHYLQKYSKHCDFLDKNNVYGTRILWSNLIVEIGYDLEKKIMFVETRGYRITSEKSENHNDIDFFESTLKKIIDWIVIINQPLIELFEGWEKEIMIDKSVSFSSKDAKYLSFISEDNNRCLKKWARVGFPLITDKLYLVIEYGWVDGGSYRVGLWHPICEKMLEFSQINKSEFLFDELLARYKVSLVKQVNWLWAVQTRDSKTAKNIFYELQEILKVNNEKAQELSN